MNKLLLPLSLLLLSSCQYISYNQVIPLIREATIGLPDIELSEEFIAKQRFSFARIDLGKGANIIMVLQKVDGNFYTWISSTGERITTYSGKIVKTEGLIHNIETFNPDLFSLLAYGTNEGTFNVMLLDPQAFVEKDFTSTLKEADNDLLVLQEEITIQSLNSSYINRYWVEKKRGMVIRSQQNIHPMLPRLTIDFIYKY